MQWRNSDFHVDDGAGFLAGVTDATPWRVFVSLAQGGRMGYLMVPDTRLAAGGTLNDYAYAERVASLLRFLAHADIFHMVSKSFWYDKL